MGVRERLGGLARWKIVIGLLVGLIAVMVVYPVARPYLQIFYDPGQLRSFIQGFGPWAPLAMIGIQVAQVLFALVPGQVVGVTAGLSFGVVWGTTLVMVGAGIGTVLGVFIAKRYGRPAVERFVDEATLDRFDGLADEYGMLSFALLILLPGFPDDAICLIAGLSELDFRWLVVWGTVLRLPGFLALAMTGDTFAVHGVKWFLAAVAVLAAISLVLFYERDRIMEYGQKWA